MVKNPWISVGKMFTMTWLVPACRTAPRKPTIACAPVLEFGFWGKGLRDGLGLRDKVEGLKFKVEG